MSSNNINNLGQKSISWENLNNALQRNNASKTTIKSAKSIFTNADKNGDGKIDAEEWEALQGEINSADQNNDGVISEEEAQNAPKDSILQKFGTKVNDFINYAKQSISDTTNEQTTPEEAKTTSSYINTDNGIDVSISETKVNPQDDSKYTAKKYDLNVNTEENRYFGHASNIHAQKTDNQEKMLQYSANAYYTSDKEINAHVGVNKTSTSVDGDTTTNKDNSATVSLKDVKLHSGTQKETEGSSVSHDYNANVDLKKLGNVDVTHTLNKKGEDNTTSTNTEEIKYSDNTIQADASSKKLDSEGNVLSEDHAKASYNTKENTTNLNFTKENNKNDYKKTQNLNIDTTTKDFGTTVTYDNNKTNNDGSQKSYTQVSSYSNNTISTDVTHKKLNSDGEILSENHADALYNTENGTTELNLKKEKKKEDYSRTQNLNLNTNTKDFEAGATYNNTKTKEDGTKSSYNVKGNLQENHTVSLGFNNSNTKNNTTNKNDATVTYDSEHNTTAKYSNTKIKEKQNENTTTTTDRTLSVDGSTTGRGNIDYSSNKTIQTTDEDGNETSKDLTNHINTTFDKKNKNLSVDYDHSKTENGELKNSLNLHGEVNEDGGSASVETSKLNKHGRNVKTTVATDVSKEAQHLGLRFKRNIENTENAPQKGEEGYKKDKSLYTSVGLTKTTQDANLDSEEDYNDYDSYDDYDNYDENESLSEDYDYSDGFGENENITSQTDKPKAKTDVDAKLKYRVGQDAISVETKKLKTFRAGYSHEYNNSQKNTQGSLTGFTQYDKETNEVNLGAGASRIKRNEDGSLKNAKAASVVVNTKTGDTKATLGYAQPIRDKNNNTVGNMSTYAQYGSKDKSITVGGQTNRIFYKQSTKADKENTSYSSEDDLFDSQNNDVEEMENIGEHQISRQDTVDEELNSAGNINSQREVAGGYSAKAEIGHASDRNPAVQYNVDVQGFANTHIGKKDATVYGRVTSTNSQLDEVSGIYGQNLRNSVSNNYNDVASNSDRVRKYKDTAYTNSSSSQNTTTIGLGAVVGNPEETGTNYATAANATLKDGKLTQYQVAGRGEYVYNTDTNRQAVGAEVSYNENKTEETKDFSTNAYYNNTFNNGKTTIKTEVGYNQNTISGETNKNLFTSFGAKQQVAKNVDVYGQVEVGRTKGSESTVRYTAIKTGVQYKLSKKTAAFVQYNTVSGTANGNSQMVSQKQKLKAGNIEFGVGVNF